MMNRRSSIHPPVLGFCAYSGTGNVNTAGELARVEQALAQ